MWQASERELGWVGAQPADDDSRLLARIGAGDHQALADLYVRHRQVLFRYLLQLTPDHQLAEDILQDTLIAVWKSARSFGGRSAVLTWLLGVARRQAHNTLRQRGMPLAANSELDTLDEQAAPDPDPQDAALAGAERAELVAALRALPIVHREVLVLVFVQGLTYQETAAVLAVPVGTVKSRLHHAKRALRALIDTGKKHEP